MDENVIKVPPPPILEWGEKFRKLSRFKDGWFVAVRHEHHTIDQHDIVWLHDEFFEKPEDVQEEVIEKIKDRTYPVDLEAMYIHAHIILFKSDISNTQIEFQPSDEESADELFDRVIEVYGVFSMQWYCVQVINLIEEATGWRNGKVAIPEPVKDEEDRFANGFRAGYLHAEMIWKHSHEIDAMRGKKVLSGLQHSARERIDQNSSDWNRRIAMMEELLLKTNGNKLDAARRTVSRLNLTISPASLVKQFNRRKNSG